MLEELLVGQCMHACINDMPFCGEMGAVFGILIVLNRIVPCEYPRALILPPNYKIRDDAEILPSIPFLWDNSFNFLGLILL